MVELTPTTSLTSNLLSTPERSEKSNLKNNVGAVRRFSYRKSF